MTRNYGKKKFYIGVIDFGGLIVLIGKCGAATWNSDSDLFCLRKTCRLTYIPLTIVSAKVILGTINTPRASCTASVNSSSITLFATTS